MKQILIPTDFSVNAEQSYPFALNIAARTRASVTFLLVIEKPFDFAIRVEDKMRGITKYAEQEFEKLLQKYREMSEYSKLNFRYQILRGKILPGIIKVGNETGADLVVLGTKGETGLKKFLFGSNASRLVRESHIPVLVIPNQSLFDGFKKIVFMTDYQEYDIELIRQVTKFAKYWNSTVETVHIARTKDLKSEIMIRGFRDMTLEQIEFEQLQFNIIYADDFLDGLASYQEPGACSLLVMGRYHNDLLDAILDFSETNLMSFYSQTPLLVLPVKGQTL